MNNYNYGRLKGVARARIKITKSTKSGVRNSGVRNPEYEIPTLMSRDTRGIRRDIEKLEGHGAATEINEENN